MKVLHLSDIHVKSEDSKFVEQFVLSPLLADIQPSHSEKQFDLVLITGDLVNRGGSAFKNRDSCFDFVSESFFQPILDSLGLAKERLYFVPGNHDVIREKDSKFVEDGLKLNLKKPEDISDFIDSGSVEGIQRIIPFKAFEKRYFSSHVDSKLTNFHSQFKIQIGQTKLGIACFNSSWRSYSLETDRHNLLVGERQISTAIDFFKDTDINIALLHHPLDWLSDFDRRCVEPLIENNFYLVFCGHVHSGSSWTKSDIYNGLFVSVAPANWELGIHDPLKEFENGYSIIDFEPDTLDLLVTNKRYSYRKNAYVANNDLGDDFGISSFKLPSSGELKSRHYERSLLSYVKTTHFAEFNEHLLTYNTDTKAPQDIKSIFVLPRIVEKIDFKGENKKEERTFDLDAICSYEQSQIIFGIRESGKTILLDELVVHFSESVQKFPVLPVLLDFQQLRTSRLETVIARYLGISITCVKDLLLEHKIVLLIDNLSFTDHDRDNLFLIEEFLKGNPNCRMIASASQPTEGVLPVDLYDFNFFIQMRRLHIKAFGASETRVLIKNWFSKNPTPDIDSKVEKLIDSLLLLNLPRTPLAISMFLWILEQQENYKPINNATMLEQFIEKLFAKHSKKEIYSDRFDFRNKERMLADIAYNMLQTGLDNYKLSYRALLNLIDDNLKAKKFDYPQAQAVLDHFLERGILTEEAEEEESFVRFRFSCFMHYFLMRKMDYDKEFRVHVLHKDNFLMFTDEIDYFTGIKRDSADILQTVIERMENEFRDVLAGIASFPHTFDQIFEGHQSFLATTDDGFVARLIQAPKPTQDDIDKTKDQALEKIRIEKGIARKQSNISPRKRMELHWTLSACVLKNAEEITVPDLKLRAYSSIVRCSMAYAILWKSFIERYIAENQKKDGFKLEEELDLQRNVLPLIHQIWLKMLLGTNKLAVTFREKIACDLRSEEISDFEKFLSVFTYSDIRGRDSNRYIHDFIKLVKNPHLVDMTLFKLISYYYLRSKTKESDVQYENMISNLFVNARGVRKSRKTKIIQDFRNMRKAELRKLKKAQSDSSKK
jgi:predicted MPP superfamily phosphohydrolase